MFNESLTKQFEQRETPFYYYDLDLLNETLNVLISSSKKRGYNVHYAIKANVNEPILNLVKKYGLGADCVSGNEVKHALNCGFKPSDIVFAGVGKSDKEINYALENDIFCYNCESVEEIEVINELASNQNKVARIAIRVNPNVDADTHKYITTGKEENKFGINYSDLTSVIEVVRGCKNVKLIGLHFHIGSQITSLNPFIELCSRVNHIWSWLIKEFPEMYVLNLGGGLGIDYKNPQNNIPDFESFFHVFENNLEVNEAEIHFELGRSIVGQCGSLITRVLYNKTSGKKNFLILDAGMTELIRPALYEGKHKIENISNSFGEECYDVVGPVCESSDTFGKNIILPISKRNDLIAIKSAGAYGEIMSSNYNLRELSEVFYSKKIVLTNC